MAGPTNFSRITRRSALGGALGLAAMATNKALAHAQTNKPNFLFIMADDLGYGDLSCYGRTEYQTPALDGLAEQGVRFTNAYANSAVCTPTRVGLITGRYQYRLPVGLQEPLALSGPGLPPSHPTMPSLLRDQGYTTSLIGKWHLGPLPDYGPLQSGYDEFWGIRSGGVDYFTHSVLGQLDLWDGTTPVKETGYITQLLGDRAVETLNRVAGGNQPFMMSLHFTAPHWPWEGPGDQAESDRLTEMGGVSILHYDGGTMESYAGMVTEMDRQIGRVLDRLNALGLADNTVVVFTSDNGGERFSKNWPFSGRKTELLEGGLRVPTIVRWPGLTAPGSVSDEQIISMDWLPTLIAEAGGSQDPHYPSDGIDIRPALAGGILPERTLFWRYNNNDQEAARQGRWKYLKIRENRFLFDVEADPLERGNLKNRYPEKFAELEAAFAQWNSQMLYDPDAPSHGPSGDSSADRYGVEPKPLAIPPELRNN